MDLACGRRCRRESYAQRDKLAQGCGRREPESRSQTGARIPRHLAKLRNLARMTGTGLLSAAALGGAFGCADPWPTGWPPSRCSPRTGSRRGSCQPGRRTNRGAANYAALLLAAGIAAVTLLGARDSGRRPAPQ